jgi:glycosyltransferase involved in cell wall biosynthesis
LAFQAFQNLTFMASHETINTEKLHRDFTVGLVSTIIPVYNRAEILGQAVQSVLDQDYRPIEIIIIDDGSTDETLAIANRLAAMNPHEIVVLHQSNSGPGPARQRGLEQARGEFIQYLDSDDLLCKSKFSRQVETLRRQPDCQICYSVSHDEIFRDGHYTSNEPTKGTGEYHSTMFPRLLVERWWSTNTPLYRHDILTKIGPWQSLMNEEDWEYDARIAARNVKLAWVPERLSIKRWFSVDQHLSSNGAVDPVKLRHRAIARCSIYRSAVAAGVSHDSPEMLHFAHSVFLIARECNAANLSEEAISLLDLSAQAGQRDRKLLWYLRVYRMMVALLGGRRAVRVSAKLHRLRNPQLN